MLAACLSALSFAEERGEASQPFLAAARQILGSQGVGQLLETLRCAAAKKSIRALLEIEVLLTHAVGQPVMLIETDPRRERQIRAHANEHATPAPVVDIEVVLHDPAVGDLKVPAVRLPVADCRHDARRLTCLEDDDDLIRLGAAEVGLDEFVAATLGCLNDRSIPSVGLVLHPVLELFGGAAQHISADRIDPPVGVEKADHPLGLLKRLDQAVEQDTVKAAVAEADAVPVMFVEGVHGRPLIRADKHNPPSDQPTRAERGGISRAKPLASCYEARTPTVEFPPRRKSVCGKAADRSAAPSVGSLAARCGRCR